MSLVTCTGMEDAGRPEGAANRARVGRGERDPHRGGRGGRHRVPRQRGAAG